MIDEVVAERDQIKEKCADFNALKSEYVCIIQWQAVIVLHEIPYAIVFFILSQRLCFVVITYRNNSTINT